MTYNTKDFHVMLLPSLACQAKCSYCFGPNKGNTMTLDVFSKALTWLEFIKRKDENLNLTFHGGEPLLVGFEWYQKALSLLTMRFGSKIKLCIQSNLWLLNDEFCNLFKEYNVSIGTSIDGPQIINDYQRGTGYYTRTMQGIKTARHNNLTIGAICTFTNYSAPFYKNILDFFISESIPFSIHEAVKTFNNKSNKSDNLSLTQDEHAKLLLSVFEYYIHNIKHTRISTFDNMIQGVASGEGCICTFKDCLGKYLAIGPEGEIYPCNRFASNKKWCLGFIQDLPSMKDLSITFPWQRLQRRELFLSKECKKCNHYLYCKGGCHYNAVVNNTNELEPGCKAYKLIFDKIIEQATDEFFSDKNLQSIIEYGTVKKGLFHNGPIIQIMSNKAHPQKIYNDSSKIVASAAIATSHSLEEAINKLNAAGVIKQPDVAFLSFKNLQHRLKNPDSNLYNAYIHITYNCNLYCTHCYTSAPFSNNREMTVDEFIFLFKQIEMAGFMKAVITGGEPLLHYDFKKLLENLFNTNHTIKVVLRTNLTLKLNLEYIQLLSKSVDQIVVSIDGDINSHNAQRGNGTYNKTITNLHSLLEVISPDKISLAATIPAFQMNTHREEEVRALGKKLGIHVTVKPILPLGRAKIDSVSDKLETFPKDYIDASCMHSTPTATCGLGYNLFIAPNSDCYPCYALKNRTSYLGNVFLNGFLEILKNNEIFKQISVDSNPECCKCSVRYICGGFCRAWISQSNPNYPPINCTHLKNHAFNILKKSLEVLEISQEHWRDFGLP